ncbi:MAG: CPBP family intramembrane metalloprotease [Bacteroidales bacterium]|nr:CPBP family intramembrane metalloprotease [Bacteroidales bacterium]
MLKGIFYSSSSGVKFVIILFLIVFCFFSSYLVGIILVNLFYNVNLFTHPEILYEINEKNISIIKLFQLTQSFGLFIVPSLFVSFLMYYSVSDYLRLNFRFSLYSLSLSVIALLCFLPFTVLLANINSGLKLPTIMKDIEEWIKNAEFKSSQLTELFLKANNFGSLLYNILIMAIIPSIGEELLFRGVFQRFFTEVFKNIHLSIIFVSLLFAIIHLQFLSFLPRFFLGIFFGYVLEITGSLVLPILLHFINNFLGIMWAYIFNNPTIFSTPPTNLSKTTLVISITGYVAGLLCLYLLYRKRKKFISL